MKRDNMLHSSSIITYTPVLSYIAFLLRSDAKTLRLREYNNSSFVPIPQGSPVPGNPTESPTTTCTSDVPIFEYGFIGQEQLDKNRGIFVVVSRNLEDREGCQRCVFTLNHLKTTLLCTKN